MTESEFAEEQKTIQRDTFAAGVGLFTGEKVGFRLCPAPADSGIVFQRVDLPEKPKIPARLGFVRPAPRCTRLGSEQGSIYMVEHLLAALHAFGVDNATVEVEGPEIPAGDGSALMFVDLIEKAGLIRQGAPRKKLRLVRPVYWSEGEAQLVALPSSEFRLSYTLHYPQSALIKSQYYTMSLSSHRFKEEIAPSRTFSLYEDIFPFVEKGVIKGGGLENAVVIKGDEVLNPEGLRFPDEMVRHKILDLIGDLSLIGMPICAHIIAIRSGHASNVAFAKIMNAECH